MSGHAGKKALKAPPLRRAASNPSVTASRTQAVRTTSSIATAPCTESSNDGTTDATATTASSASEAASLPIAAAPTASASASSGSGTAATKGGHKRKKRRGPLVSLPPGTTVASLICWNAASAQQVSATRDEELCFVRYWAKGNPWMVCRKANGQEGVLRTEFLAPVLEGPALAAVLADARGKLPGILGQLKRAKITNDKIADHLVEAPMLAGLATEMHAAGAVEVLCDRVADDSMSLTELKWALGGETGVLANICSFVEDATAEVVRRKLIPKLCKRARGLLTGESEVGVNSVAGRSVQLLAKIALSTTYHKHVCTQTIVSTVLAILSNKSNGLHNWKKLGHEKSWSIFLVFAWAAEFVSALALHDAGRKVLLETEAVKALRKVDAAVEGATAKDFADGTLALLQAQPAGARTAPGEGHIMVSYNWGTQKLALRLKDALEKAGYAVWIDLEKMEGNIMLRMAEAVEGAAVVLLLYSQRYADSRNCNMEAQYVQQLERRFIPVLCEQSATTLSGDGGRMLNFMRGTKLYVDLSEADKSGCFEAKFQELAKQLGSAGKGSGARPAPHRTTSQPAASTTIAARVASLEAENKALKTRVATLESIVKKMAAAYPS